MFQIKNNQVYITRGEDAVYTRSVKRADKYHSPYIISEGLENLRIRFSVKANKNDKDPVLEYEGSLSDEVPRFRSQVIIDLGTGAFPEDDIQNQVYRKIEFENERPKYKYYYFKDGEWKTYELIIRIPFSTNDTKKLTPGTYYYDIALISRDSEGEIEYSDQWLIPTEFIIGGSLSE